MNNILFIGGAGFIGSNLIKSFTDKTNYSIFVLEPPYANTLRLSMYNDKISLLKGLISDFESLKKHIEDNKINKIVHLVSNLIPGSNFDDYKSEQENIIFPSIELINFCSEKNIKFIYFSSGGTIYGNSQKEKFNEKDALEPISYYGLSKQIIENNILFSHRTKKLNYLIIRPSNPFGPGQSIYANQGFIAIAIGKIIKNEPISIWGDGNSMRDYLYIDDLSNAFFELIDNNISNEIINIGSGQGYSINDIIVLLKNTVNKNFTVNYENSRNVDVNKMILDISKLQSLINFKITPMKIGIESFYSYIKSNNSL